MCRADREAAGRVALAVKPVPGTRCARPVDFLSAMQIPRPMTSATTPATTSQTATTTSAQVMEIPLTRLPVPSAVPARGGRYSFVIPVWHLFNAPVHNS